jgi:hypothetical protein
MKTTNLRKEGTKFFFFQTGDQSAKADFVNEGAGSTTG